ncbi:TPA: family 78 glycoside hydrolase catalytic domain [Klebsiella pneumoniae]|uniref:alpha-L-rhamnosidase-related protein n=1 Tax=Klebsiella pneumoniae TaxID=573 RepID=UPI000DE77D83|nr:family 78 glycoside hydrolase catalytic domain [Klebsiella pneumoniae]SSI81202.1 alpha-L-rhamnosidase [Klebsiella pneumoniae]HBR2229141.1 family 78 glycoside hydrolase catalytic domain [Klebsiella pneumoniae]
MNRRDLLINTAIAVTSYGLITGAVKAQSKNLPVSPSLPSLLKAHHNLAWVTLAEKLKPPLIEREVAAVAIVTASTEKDSLQQWIMVKDQRYSLSSVNEVPLHTGESVIIDFAEHLTGFLSFNVNWVGRGNDAPTRLRLIFGEVPNDVIDPLYPYSGKLSASWLPDEIINIDHIPASIDIPRRHAFRYVKIEVMSASTNFGITLNNIRTSAVSSAGNDRYPLDHSLSAEWQRIDAISLKTLHECMQTTFEDGPRRDQRLWLGDLRLQAITNYVSYGKNDLVKRCLYLFAGLANSEGLITACVYEKPSPSAGEGVMLDYAALFGPTLVDYWQATGDQQTLMQLLPLAIRQLTLITERYLDPKGLIQVPNRPFTFIDWQEGLDKQGAMQGLLIYCCRRVREVTTWLSDSNAGAQLDTLIQRMTTAARQWLWRDDLQLFISGEIKQLSWATQIWMVLAGVVGRTQGSQLLHRVMAQPEAVTPLTPYLYHHLVSAFVACDDSESGRNVVLNYWGVMARGGVDTFWEAFDPHNPAASPYGATQINSYCHAWSCTPAYFIRTKFSQA